MVRSAAVFGGAENVDRRTELSRSRSRYVPAKARRKVYERHAGFCSYVDSRGQRCCETIAWRSITSHPLPREERTTLRMRRAAAHGAISLGAAGAR